MLIKTNKSIIYTLYTICSYFLLATICNKFTSNACNINYNKKLLNKVNIQFAIAIEIDYFVGFVLYEILYAKV